MLNLHLLFVFFLMGISHSEGLEKKRGSKFSGNIPMKTIWFSPAGGEVRAQGRVMLPPRSSSHHTTEPWQALAQGFKAKLSQLPVPPPLLKVTLGSRAQHVPVQSAESQS